LKTGSPIGVGINLMLYVAKDLLNSKYYESDELNESVATVVFWTESISVDLKII